MGNGIWIEPMLVMAESRIEAVNMAFRASGLAMRRPR